MTLLLIDMKKIFAIIMALVTGAVSISALGLGIHGVEAGIMMN